MSRIRVWRTAVQSGGGSFENPPPLFIPGWAIRDSSLEALRLLHRAAPVRP